jgi:hypothetical protein
MGMAQDGAKETTESPPQTCKSCIYFFVTYDPNFPYGCRGLGIKSRRHPYHEVVAASGVPCQMRQTKDSP